MERINIRIMKKTHRRLNLLKGQMGLHHMDDGTPTLDEVINAGLDLLENGKDKKGEDRVGDAQGQFVR